MTNGNGTLRTAWRLIVLVVGVTLLLLGVAMLVLPGPGIVVILVGLSVLGSEFVWARHLLGKARELVTAKTGLGPRP